MRDRAPAAMQAITTVDPEARPMLETLRDMGVAMGVISNTPFPAFAIDNYLEQKSLLEFFPVRIYSSDVGYMKPDARIFRIALEEMGIRAERSLYVGDRVDKDVRGSKRVGMTSVQFCKGAPAVQGRIRPDHRITRLAELPDIVNQLRPCGSI